MRLLSGTGVLGYGFESEWLTPERTGDLSFVGNDGGSTDNGPYHLGSGLPFGSRAAVQRDLTALLDVSASHQAPLVIGTCGGSGTNTQIDWLFDIVRDDARLRGRRLKIALIRTELGPDRLEEALAEGLVTPLDGVPELSTDTVRASERLVAMMGVEPIMAALRSGADVVLAGRCSDAAIFAAGPILAGEDPAMAWYAGKLLECGATCATPAGPDAVVAELAGGELTVFPTNPARRCTVKSVMEMSLHENADPFLHRESSGTLDLTHLQLAEIALGRVRASGAVFHPAKASTVKVEGVRKVGHRFFGLAATRDPRLVAILDPYLETVEERWRRRLAAMGIDRDACQLFIRSYGRNGVLGELEFASLTLGHEVACLYEVIAETAEIASAGAAAYRSLLLHTDFAGRQCTEGNFAFPFSPSEFDGGEAFEFSVWHSMRVADPLALFDIEYRTVSENSE